VKDADELQEKEKPDEIVKVKLLRLL